ncbi:NUDIX hydrolase [Rossellomorea marisflavi]|uniref:NUDIX hydrolase n=1 Tax=Rossellomorea TaxID=2837508 RepID=UPI00064F5676|nr:NUDIX hydrolase [Rossellomorea marisflavi]KMK97405.1 DNA mismatch repair protein MutT [Rossellomorea marisflavi]MCM2604151.1 NUDIX hydrolase [Rossellomorea marisflavi]QHA36566.1 NUDIX domain-containing protein [Rossellomorea marisflavi]TYO72752.1 NUDIX hydrolase [Rossellomorea marisflavi]USK90429.1 NUDIX hydrolase [Rossellomorea marisflavi]
MGYIEELRSLIGTRPVNLVGSTVILTDGEGRILLQRRTFPAGKWGLPGGLMELGESAEETARREVKEETNLDVGRLHLVSVYSGQDQYIEAANGDQFYSVTICFHSEEFTGDLKLQRSEGTKLEFISPKDVPDNMVASHRRMVADFLGMKNNQKDDA